MRHYVFDQVTSTRRCSAAHGGKSAGLPGRKSFCNSWRQCSSTAGRSAEAEQPNGHLEGGRADSDPGCTGASGAHSTLALPLPDCSIRGRMGSSAAGEVPAEDALATTALRLWLQHKPSLSVLKVVSITWFKKIAWHQSTKARSSPGYRESVLSTAGCARLDHDPRSECTAIGVLGMLRDELAKLHQPLLAHPYHAEHSMLHLRPCSGALLHAVLMPSSLLC